MKGGLAPRVELTAKEGRKYKIKGFQFVGGIPKIVGAW